jgi:uncharacterized protein (TIGR02246 family)
MRSNMRLMVATILLLFACTRLLAQDADERAVRAVVQQYVDARERRDATAIASVLTEDADQFTTAGEWRRGREAVVRGGLASSQRNPGTRAISVEVVRFVSPDVAIADGGYQIRSASASAPRTMWTTLVLRRGSDGWRIAAIRNTVPTGRP